MGHAKLWKGLQKLEGRLLECKSATKVLEDWCGRHGLAHPARIGAVTIAGTFKEMAEDQLEHLQVESQDDVAYRRVELVCGELLVCEADNWYVPSRLTDAMNHELQTTDTPFGRVVVPLDVYRDTYSMTVFVRNLPLSGMEPGVPHKKPWTFDGSQDLLRHRGLVLQRAGNLPLAEVHEVFKMSLLEPFVTQS